MIPVARIKNRGQRTAPHPPGSATASRPYPVVGPTDRVVFDGEPAVVLKVLASGRLLDLLVGRDLRTVRKVPFSPDGIDGWRLPSMEPERNSTIDSRSSFPGPEDVANPENLAI